MKSSKLNIPCQYKPTQNITEMFLFDLQTVAFFGLEKRKVYSRYGYF
jgi:hypothetical protein